MVGAVGWDELKNASRQVCVRVRRVHCMRQCVHGRVERWCKRDTMHLAEDSPVRGGMLTIRPLRGARACVSPGSHTHVSPVDGGGGGTLGRRCKLADGATRHASDLGGHDCHFVMKL